MLTSSYRIFSIFGIPVKLDASLAILAGLLVWSLGNNLFPQLLPLQSLWLYYLMAFATTLGMFASIIFHELAHSLVARYYGIQINGISLFLFGGVAEMTKEPPTAKSEFLVAVAGPVSSFVLAGILYIIDQLFLASAPVTPLIIVYYLFLMNMALAIFNLLPAFPLDGGRMLRALLWWLKGDLSWATIISSWMGTVLGLALAGYGLYSWFQEGSLSSIWQILIGFFIIRIAASARKQAGVLEALRGVTVKMLMKEPPMGLRADMGVAQLLWHKDLANQVNIYPVVENDKLVGVIQPLQIAEDHRHQGDSPLRDFATRLRRVECLTPDQSAMDAISQLGGARNFTGLVIEDGQLVGQLWLGDILSYAEKTQKAAEQKKSAADSDS